MTTRSKQASEKSTIRDIDERLQSLHRQLDGVRGEVCRCADEAGYDEKQRQQREATDDYFLYFFGPPKQT